MRFSFWASAAISPLSHSLIRGRRAFCFCGIFFFFLTSCINDLFDLFARRDMFNWLDHSLPTVRRRRRKRRRRRPSGAAGATVTKENPSVNNDNKWGGGRGRPIKTEQCEEQVMTEEHGMSDKTSQVLKMSAANCCLRVWLSRTCWLDSSFCCCLWLLLINWDDRWRHFDIRCLPTVTWWNRSRKWCCSLYDQTAHERYRVCFPNMWTSKPPLIPDMKDSSFLPFHRNLQIFLFFSPCSKCRVAPASLTAVKLRT